MMDMRIKESKIASYCDRIKASGVKVNNKMLKEKLKKMNDKELTETLNKIVSAKDKDIIKTLNKLGVNAMSSKITTEQAKEEVQKRLNLEGISEFKNDEKDYFKFKDKNGKITVTRNIGNDSKDLFLTILNESKNINKDGRENADEIFKLLTDYQLIEINMKSSKNIEKDKNTKVDKVIMDELQKRFPNKEIVYSVKEKIYIVKGNEKEDEKDKILNIEYKDGKINIHQIEQKGYEKEKVDEKDNSIQNEQDINEEEVNEIPLDIENNEDLQKIIIENEKNNIAEDITIEDIDKKIKEMYPEYKDKNIKQNIKNFVSKFKKERVLGGRQYVLKNNNKPI